MGSNQEIIENYQCPKCRGKSPLLRNITLPKSSLQSILPLAAGKYIFVTCTLCGYTEIYDAVLYAKEEQESENKARVPDQAGPTV